MVDFLRTVLSSLQKEQLEIRCSELESLYENMKLEMMASQEALSKFQSSQLESTRTGIEHEESLLHESAARESSLNTQVLMSYYFFLIPHVEQMCGLTCDSGDQHGNRAEADQERERPSEGRE